MKTNKPSFREVEQILKTYGTISKEKLIEMGFKNYGSPISRLRKSGMNIKTYKDIVYGTFYSFEPYFKGEITEAAVFNKELSDKEMETVYKGGSYKIKKRGSAHRMIEFLLLFMLFTFIIAGILYGLISFISSL